MDFSQGWEDVKPIPESLPPAPFCAMKYSESCKNYAVSLTLSYFRAVLLAEEVSNRAFNLTTEVLYLSPGFYAAWHYRRHLLHALNKPLEPELAFLTTTCMNHPKNYQLWHYRKELLSLCTNPCQELEFSQQILKIDDRNVHAWGFRQWVTSKFNLWDSELEFIKSYIAENERNNSAWNYRRFIIMNSSNLLTFVEKAEGEIEFSKEYMKNIQNESCFGYVRSFYCVEVAEKLKEVILGVVEQEGISQGVLKLILHVAEKEKKPQICKYACQKLIEIDAVHKNYWQERLLMTNTILDAELSTYDERILNSLI